MKNSNRQKITNLKMIRSAAAYITNALAIAIVCTLLSAAMMATARPSSPSSEPSASTGQTATIKAKEETPQAVARRELSRLPSVTGERIASIKDPKVRAAAQRTYQLMKTIADNKDPQKEQALVKQFDQAYLTLVTESSKGGYQTCTFKCKSDAGKCQSACTGAGKKFCGCKLAGFGCFVAECVLG